jgi:hypothetical protein
VDLFRVLYCSGSMCVGVTVWFGWGDVVWYPDAGWSTTLIMFIIVTVINQLETQNLFYNVYFTPLHVSSTCAHHQEVKIALHSLWYHHTYRCDDTRGCVMHETATYRRDDTIGCVMQLWPADDEHMWSKHVEAWNKLIVNKHFVHQVGYLLR